MNLNQKLLKKEINQIKEAEDKLLSQYEDAFRENTSADKQVKNIARILRA